MVAAARHKERVKPLEFLRFRRGSACQEVGAFRLFDRLPEAPVGSLDFSQAQQGFPDAARQVLPGVVHPLLQLTPVHPQGQPIQERPPIQLQAALQLVFLQGGEERLSIAIYGGPDPYPVHLNHARGDPLSRDRTVLRFPIARTLEGHKSSARCHLSWGPSSAR